MRAAVVSLATLAALAAPSVAAASDGETAVSVYGGYAGLTIDEDIQPVGGAIGVDYERGFSEILSWRVSGSGGIYSGEEGSAYSGQVTAGITYIFDVLKWVPYANLGAGAIVVSGDEFDTALHPLIELGFGIDRLHSRTFSYGFAVKVESFVTNTAFFTGGVRVTWRWGFF